MPNAKREKNPSLDALDEKIIERQRLSHVFNKLAGQNGPVEDDEATMNAFFTTWQLRELVENYGNDPLDSSDISELVKILDPLGQGQVLVRSSSKFENWNPRE
ncbi:unnamed protein product [Oikopleura dioica]|uniref:Uncharacterized protein n=1 Tax=Oikopleura dioica TaxID=34765 RepID=E4XE91_OIKDI|nr:unnamed protein product [Oikopleura dioica]CBY35263.1 unnamed protein product [Oikopleura dioica]